MFSLGSVFFSLSGNSSDSTTNQVQEWATIETRRGDLSVSLPRNPVYESDQTQNTIEHYAYTATDSDGTIYLVKYENFAEIAKTFGLNGYKITKPDEISKYIKKAVNSNKTSVLDIDIDGSV